MPMPTLNFAMPGTVLQKLTASVSRLRLDSMTKADIERIEVMLGESKAELPILDPMNRSVYAHRC